MVDLGNSIMVLIVSLICLHLASGLSYQYQKLRPSSSWSPVASAWQPLTVAQPSPRTSSPLWRAHPAGKQEEKGLSARTASKSPYAPANHRHPVNYYAFRSNNDTGDYETLRAAEPLYASAAKLSRHMDAADLLRRETNSKGPHLAAATGREVEKLNKASATNSQHQSPGRLQSQSHDVTGDNVDFNKIAAKTTAPLLYPSANEATWRRSAVALNESSLDQGNHFIGGPSEDAIGRSLAEWQGRKLKKVKKKLKKLLLPLLIAYKLKFLTLIPVLIGGLILLVGTTGLAGFFFALFTAVMSLKSSSGHKSIVVKRL